MSEDARTTELIWKEDWDAARRHHCDWWQQQELVLWVTASRDRPAMDLEPPPAPTDLRQRWFDPEWRLRQQEYQISRCFYGGDAFPLFSSISAAGDLGAYVGCQVGLSPQTVWCEPCIGDPPEGHPPIRLDRQSWAFRQHVAMVELAVRESGGRWLVTPPDLVENVDILSAMRGPQPFLLDLVDRPEWVEQKVREINQAFFEAFNVFYEMVRDGYGGNGFVFNVWGPGRTAKVQCDACAMFGPEMFRRFVTPALTEQCDWLDYALYHLDGEDCLVNLDELLAIDSLNAIEWTPRRLSVGDSGGHPRHWELYRRILAAGKSVQAIGVKYEEVIPLLDACGGTGMFVTTSAPTEEDARRLAEEVAPYRP
ncbi:MAG: hypothetical protein JW741_25355 [Sedimentisphaerales bacterium]|nr:hypothetical protein [Sedimentisphaerales bacterium]